MRIPSVLIAAGTLLLSVGLALSSAGVAWAFHSWETLLCTQCHNVHDGKSSSLLKLEDGNSLCLSCHDASKAEAPYNTDDTPKVVGAQKPLAGGDFKYELESGGSTPGYGHALGSPLPSPGGEWSGPLHCLTCHDAHGNGQYRSLRVSVNNRETPVEGVGDPDWERTASSTDHNAYTKGFSKFCGACHEGFFSSDHVRGTSGYIRHPSDVAVVGNVARGAIYGSDGGEYDPNIPLQGMTSTSQGAVSSSHQVFCLSCHRAHASPFPYALRWDNTKPEEETFGCAKCHVPM